MSTLERDELSLAPPPNPRTYHIEFLEVGRYKRSWNLTTHSEPSEAQLEKFVRKSRALLSTDVECVFNDDRTAGMVCAGHGPVGTFKVTKL
jgi:hypothetical protein